MARRPVPSAPDRERSRHPADHPYQPETEETNSPTDTEQPAADSGDVTTQESSTEADTKPASEAPTEAKPSADAAKDPNPADLEPLQVPALSTDSE